MQRVLTATVITILFCTACATVEKAPADARLMEAQKAFDEGQRLKVAGQYAKAVPLVEHALELWEATLGGVHPTVASCLHLLGDIHGRQAGYERAEQLLERALSIREAALGKDHPEVAQLLNSLASIYMVQANYAQAEPLLEHALSSLEAALGMHHPDVAATLQNLALLHNIKGNYARAEPLFERALAIREAALGMHHPDVATTLQGLALLHNIKGNHEQAEPLLERALVIREATLGRHHPEVASTLQNLAFLHHVRGNHARAEPLYARALTTWETALGKHHPNVIVSLNGLASIYSAQGNYARAEPLYARALTTLETNLGKHHHDAASLLNNLAVLHGAQGSHARAEPMYERAIAIREAAFGENHPEIAPLLNNLAVCHLEQGDYARAEPLLQRALTIREAALGKHHPGVANLLHNFAVLYSREGNHARAEPLFERALEIWKATLYENHLDVANALNEFALLRIAQQNLTGALSLFTRAFITSEEHLRREILGFSEARLASILHLLHADEERLYTLVRAHPNDARVRHLALSAALLRKGRSVEEISDTSRVIYRGLGPSDRQQFERLRTLRTQLSTLSLAGPGHLSPADYQQRLKHLDDQGDALEAELARRSAPLRALHSLPPPDEIVGRVAAALPEDGALIEFVTYRESPLVPKPSSLSSPSNPRYLALLLFPDGTTSAVDLGPAAPIDRASLRLHAALSRRSSSYQPAAQALYSLSFRPLVPLLGKARRLFLSPDGQLALVPFAALHDGRRFLLDSFDFTYLTSGKELLPRTEGIPPSRSVVVLADPDFGSTPSTPSPIAESTSTLTERSASLERFFSSPRSDLTDQPWPSLPGTRKEAEAIQRLLPQAQLLLGPAASKDALLKLETPGLLHIATHGFFLEDDGSAPATSRAVGSFGAVGDAGPRRPPDPLLRSGLVLAGAHSPAAQPGSPRRDDSLVTALELAGLNLWGTQLVVLSACDTGRGDARLGQGIYGLRRALSVAGAETLVTSLWKVNDAATHEFMEGYYRNLLSGQGRIAALREAMRALRLKQPHPYFWAPFIAIGQDSPLRGLAAPKDTTTQATPSDDRGSLGSCGS